jgi:hypothetical protein
MPTDASSAERFVGAYPAVELVSEHRFARRWSVFTHARLPPQEDLDAMSEQIESAVTRELREALATEDVETVGRNLPGVRLVRMDDEHCVVVIELPRPEVARGDAAAVGPWGTLQRLDERLRIRELQGLPREAWFTLR